jgi:hypothetical protein
MASEPADDRRPLWSEAQVRALGVTTDLVTAGAVLGIGRTTAHALARANEFPVPVLRVGRRYRVPTAPLLQLLALTTGPPPNALVAGGPAAGERPFPADAGT